MGSTTAIPLRQPSTRGFMAPSVVLEMVSAVGDVMGAEALEMALKDANLFRLPSETEPVREDKAARLHQTIRQLWPEQAIKISEMAGKGAAQKFMETQITARAREMLGQMPRATGAWLLAKTARQNAWVFAGSGDFVVESEQRFVLRNNPVVSGEAAEASVCHFHASLFEELFSTLIHPRLVCREVSCQAAGAQTCIFEFSMAA